MKLRRFIGFLFVLIGVSMLIYFNETDSSESAPLPSAMTEAAQAIQEERHTLDETVWSDEVLAQEYEQAIVHYWDQMLQPKVNKFPVLASFPFETITLGGVISTDTLDWDIARTHYGGEGKTLDRAGWQDLLRKAEDEGYHVHEIEFHQANFSKGDDGAAKSTFNILLHVTKADTKRRWIVKGALNIDWSDKKDERGLHVARSLNATDLHIMEREGPFAFADARPIETMNNLALVLAYDLNRDGLSDIALPIQNIVFWNQGNGEFEKDALVTPHGILPPRENVAAIIADFTNDGYADLMCTGMYGNINATTVVLFRGDAEGRFGSKGQVVNESLPPLLNPLCITAGDIDGDGDLDVWLGQYKTPYEGGQMPTPFYDANDGNPSFLLVNEGEGRFTDGTVAAGLADKRQRRTYSASFTDLDDDNDLDLLVVNDFAGVDVYHNDGSGLFSDVTADSVDDASNFGMAHTFGDYNADGELDFFVTGMASTTMRRLNHMGLGREEFPEYNEMRTRMGYGNRMYLAKGQDEFQQPTFKDSVARSGWSWGVTSLDFDNDGDLDIYLANGHLSDKTTKDYCTQFWCHDIYTDASVESTALNDFFLGRTTTNSFSDMSWDGYQKNHLFMNDNGKDFVNVAFLMNAALGFDARCVLTDDLNADGRPDLIVTSAHNTANTSKARSSLYFLENTWQDNHNWIGVRLQEDPGKPSPVGAKITVRYGSKKAVGRIVTGDSYRSQHANTKHFGLGAMGAVDAIEVTWPNGASTTIEKPAINQYHLIRAADIK
jgi:hypothetical protein